MTQEVTTISQLAELINKRFEAQDQKFENIDRKFESIDQKFEDLTEIIITNFDRIEEDFKGMRKEIRAVEVGLGERISRIEYNTGRYEARTSILEDKVRKISNPDF